MATTCLHSVDAVAFLWFFIFDLPFRALFDDTEALNLLVASTLMVGVSAWRECWIDWYYILFIKYVNYVCVC